MNHETWWSPALIALGVAVVVGLVLVVRYGRGPAAGRGAPPLPVGTDLERQRDALFQQIRDLDAAFATMDPADYRLERARLEIEAARTLRDLAAAASPTEAGDPGATEPRPGPARWTDRHPRLVGALWGAGIVGFALALWMGLEQSTSLRTEGMTATGNAQSGGGGAMRDASAILAQARAAMEANPDDLDAKARYGFAVLETGDVRGAFDVASEVTARVPDHPLARTLQAVILMQIGDTRMAAGVLDKVLAAHPDAVEALGYRGALHFQAGEYAQAAARWEHLLEVDPAQRAAVGPLLERARRLGTEAPTAAAAPASSVPAAAEAAATPSDVTGTVRLANGARAPASGTLFIFARPTGVESGPPAAAKRLPASPLPQDFRLGPSDSPMGGAFPASMTLTARVDADGNPSTRSPDDLVARAENVAPGATGVVLDLAPAGN